MIPVVITCVNLNKMNVHVKNLKMKFCHSYLTSNIFNLHMRRFFFGLVYVFTAGIRLYKVTVFVLWYTLNSLIIIIIKLRYGISINVVHECATR